MPIWGLDGDHAFKALNRTERWIAQVSSARAIQTGEGLLGIAGSTAVQAFREAYPPRRRRSHRAHPVRRPRHARSLLMKMRSRAAMTLPDIYYKRSRFSTRLPGTKLYTASTSGLEAEPGAGGSA
jgi:hypothetical protein